MIELTQNRFASPQVLPSDHQQSRLVIALVLLLAALAAVLVKDRQFWFGSESTIVDAHESQPVAVPQAAKTEISTKPASPALTHTPAAVKKQAVPTSKATEPSTEAPAVVSQRTVLPPLDVEVIAGEMHKNLHPRSNATKVQIAKPAVPPTSQAGAEAAPATNAAQRERLAEAIPPSYPALAQHMNVQGSVVLQALIGVDGTVQNLRVMSGPAILASAAQQAVRDWRFKPVYQNGAAVETRATITVNFTIRVSESTPNTTLAESSADDVNIGR